MRARTWSSVFAAAWLAAFAAPAAAGEEGRSLLDLAELRGRRE